MRKSFRPTSFAGKRNRNFCKDKQLRFSGLFSFGEFPTTPHSTFPIAPSPSSQTLHSSSRNRYGAAAFLSKCSCNIKPCSKEQKRTFKKQQSLNLLHRPSPPFLFRGDPASGRASGKARPFCFWRRENPCRIFAKAEALLSFENMNIPQNSTVQGLQGARVLL